MGLIILHEKYVENKLPLSPSEKKLKGHCSQKKKVKGAWGMGLKLFGRHAQPCLYRYKKLDNKSWSDDYLMKSNFLLWEVTVSWTPVNYHHHLPAGSIQVNPYHQPAVQEI